MACQTCNRPLTDATSYGDDISPLAPRRCLLCWLALLDDLSREYEEMTDMMARMAAIGLEPLPGSAP